MKYFPYTTTCVNSVENGLFGEKLTHGIIDNIFMNIFACTMSACFLVRVNIESKGVISSLGYLNEAFSNCSPCQKSICFIQI